MLYLCIADGYNYVNSETAIILCDFTEKLIMQF